LERKIEICVFNIKDCINAAKYKIDRIEFCQNRAGGGISPEKKDITEVIKLHPHIYPIIRPRKGDFIYSQSEFDAMIDLVIFCRKIGCKGVVFGILDNKNHLDIKRSKVLKQASGGMSTTFHKAFDEIEDVFEGINGLINLGFDRILTSGKSNNAINGIKLINELSEKSHNKISIMPGGGIRSNNIDEFLKNKYLREFHSSCIINNKFEESELKRLINRISYI